MAGRWGSPPPHPRLVGYLLDWCVKRATVYKLGVRSRSRLCVEHVSHARLRWGLKGATMKGTALVVTLIVVAAVGFASGWYFHQGRVQTGSGMRPTTAITWKVVDVIDSNNSCKQLDSGSGGFAKLPELRRGFGDSVTWVKGIAPGGGSAPLVVTFPQTSNGHIGTPFVDSNGNPKFVFKDGDNSGAPARGAPNDVYLYESLTIGGTACTNPQDPGVHVDN